MSELIRFPCRACGKRLKAPFDFTGRQVRCSCGESQLVPGPEPLPDEVPTPLPPPQVLDYSTFQVPDYSPPELLPPAEPEPRRKRQGLGSALLYFFFLPHTFGTHAGYSFCYGCALNGLQLFLALLYASTGIAGDDGKWVRCLGLGASIVPTVVIPAIVSKWAEYGTGDFAPQPVDWYRYAVALLNVGQAIGVVVVGYFFVANSSPFWIGVLVCLVGGLATWVNTVLVEY